MITIDFSDIDPDKIVAKCEEQIADYLEDKITDVYTDLTAPPPKGTPVDQGTARNGWQLDTSVKLAPEVYNSIPYIGRLADGWSKQTQAGWVDRAIDDAFRD